MRLVVSFCGFYRLVDQAQLSQSGGELRSIAVGHMTALEGGLESFEAFLFPKLLAPTLVVSEALLNRAPLTLLLHAVLSWILL